MFVLFILILLPIVIYVLWFIRFHSAEIKVGDRIEAGNVWPEEAEIWLRGYVAIAKENKLFIIWDKTGYNNIWVNKNQVFKVLSERPYYFPGFYIDKYKIKMAKQELQKYLDNNYYSVEHNQ